MLASVQAGGPRGANCLLRWRCGASVLALTPRGPRVGLRGCRVQGFAGCGVRPNEGLAGAHLTTRSSGPPESSRIHSGRGRRPLSSGVSANKEVLGGLKQLPERCWRMAQVACVGTLHLWSAYLVWTERQRFCASRSFQSVVGWLGKLAVFQNL